MGVVLRLERGVFGEAVPNLEFSLTKPAKKLATKLYKKF